MNYLIVIKADGKSYLVLAEDNSLSAYASKEDLLMAYKGYTNMFQGSYENAMSACIGMIQATPTAIRAPENPEDLKKYLLDSKTYTISGGAIGRGYKGTPVSEDIYELKEFDLFEATLYPERHAALSFDI